MPLIKPLIFIGKVFSEVSPMPHEPMKKLEKDQEEFLIFYNFSSAQSTGYQ
ncbi:MAG: hypothetical protein ACTS73_02225 [Arsenophonus sp. NEOnobi-MAG3]